jgi:hypothetical protein
VERDSGCGGIANVGGGLKIHGGSPDLQFSFSDTGTKVLFSAF